MAIFYSQIMSMDANATVSFQIHVFEYDILYRFAVHSISSEKENILLLKCHFIRIDYQLIHSFLDSFT